MKKIFLRFHKQCETMENHSDSELRTHYYKTNAGQMLQSLEELFRKKPDCRISTVSKEHGELAVEMEKPFHIFMVATVISIKPYETAVDFHLSTENTRITGAYPTLRKEILDYYNSLNKLHTYIGSGKNHQ